jgi:RIO-like serine/threonine protein kinase
MLFMVSFCDLSRPLVVLIISPGHKDAFDIGILHRDISVGNIIIHQGKGWLIDWDMSKPISANPELETPRRATRTVSSSNFSSC